MGMDLIARRNRRRIGYHANWTGWSMISGALSLLGADMAEMAGSNDGDYVTASTARSWASCIRAALSDDSLKMVQVSDPSISGGIGTLFVPGSMPDDVAASMRHVCPRKEAVVPLDVIHREWLLDFADFCEQSGGFWQY